MALNSSGEQSWSNAHTTARQINERILKVNKCEICGSEKNLDVHHKNWNWRDNSLENLQVLCRSCHEKIHKEKGTCNICGKPMKGHGFCNKHYIRYKKFGCPLYLKENESCKSCPMTYDEMEVCINNSTNKNDVSKYKAQKNKVYCENNNKFYKSINQASKELHIEDENIRKVCDGERDNIRGYVFRWGYQM